MKNISEHCLCLCNVLPFLFSSLHFQSLVSLFTLPFHRSISVLPPLLSSVLHLPFISPFLPFSFLPFFLYLTCSFFPFSSPFRPSRRKSFLQTWAHGEEKFGGCPIKNLLSKKIFRELKRISARLWLIFEHPMLGGIAPNSPVSYAYKSASRLSAPIPLLIHDIKS